MIPKRHLLSHDIMSQAHSLIHNSQKKFVGELGHWSAKQNML